MFLRTSPQFSYCLLGHTDIEPSRDLVQEDRTVTFHVPASRFEAAHLLLDILNHPTSARASQARKVALAAWLRSRHSSINSSGASGYDVFARLRMESMLSKRELPS